MTTPTVSVALCTYNGARFIGAQLRSIFDQSRSPDEIVVSDDGSRDETLQQIRDIAADAGALPVTVLPPSPRLGVTRNFQRAMEACSGELIVLSDQDDIWHVDRVRAALDVFASDPRMLLVHSDARLVDGAGAPLGASLFESLRVSRRDRDAIRSGRAFELLLRRNLATGATIMFRRELLASALPFPMEWVHDEWLAILAAAAGRITMLDQQLIDYRQHGSNQIGVAQPTLSHRLGRLLGRRGDRYQVLAERASLLVQRLEREGASEDLLDLASGKARFEARRAIYPGPRAARIPLIASELLNGSYRRYSSQRNLDVVRDLLQPA